MLLNFIPIALQFIIPLLAFCVCPEVQQPAWSLAFLPVLHLGQHSTSTCISLFNLKTYQVKARAM
jgi:hypothetical protein